MSRSNSLPPTGRRIVAAAALAGTLAACTADRAVTGSTYPRDYRDRHPIVLADAPRSLDVFVRAPSGLDRRQREDVRAFAEEFRKAGQSAMVAQVPVATRDEIAVQRTLEAVRDTLSASGVPGGALAVTTYYPADPAVTSPIRLSFQRLQAKVDGKCGLWPQDLGVSDVRFNARNDPYWNFGCAMQTNVAAQVADPVDLVRGRTEGRIDTIRRAKDIENLRQGKDPSTSYRQDNTNKINNTVGN